LGFEGGPAASANYALRQICPTYADSSADHHACAVTYGGSQRYARSARYRPDTPTDPNRAGRAAADFAAAGVPATGNADA
jgi:hypothetical protein